MNLYSNELSVKIYDAFSEHIDTSDFDDDDNEYPLRDSLHGAELKALKCRLAAELTKKNERLTMIEYGIEITVYYEYENAVHSFTVRTKEEWLDGIIDLLYSTFVDEIHRIDNPNERDLEDDEK